VKNDSNLIRYFTDESSEEESSEDEEYFYCISLITRADILRLSYEEILASEDDSEEDETISRNDSERLVARNDSERLTDVLRSEPIDLLQSETTAKNETVQKRNEECSICLGEYEKEEDAVKISCDHVFHKTCLSEWEKNDNNTCPLCRRRFVFKRCNLLVSLPDGIGVILND
jgi:hypothetical protein